MEIDILNIDKNIRDKWKNNEEKITDIDKQVEDIRDILKDNALSIHIIKDLNDKVEKLLKDKQECIDFQTNLNFYVMDVTPLLESYKQMLIAPKKISFMTKKQNDNQDVRTVVKKYLEILKMYNIDYAELEDIVSSNNKSPVKKKECKKCKSTQEFIYNEYTNVEICESCGSQEEKAYKSSCYKDISRVNISNKYTYERRVHFKDCINQYQGKQNASIDDKVYKDLETQLELHGIVQTQQQCENMAKRFSNVTKEHILLFLKETGHSKHYEDVVLIYHKLTGKKVDDISHIEDALMEDFDKISNVYDQKFKFTGKIDRKSFINTQYVLFQLLRKHKYPCKRNDFNMLKTLDRKSFHDDVVKEIFEHLNFNFTPIF
jgi:hypothetical protein